MDFCIVKLLSNMLHTLGLCCVHAKPHTHIHPLVHLWTSISTKKTLHKQTSLYFPTCTHILMSPFDTPHLYTHVSNVLHYTPLVIYGNTDLSPRSPCTHHAEALTHTHMQRCATGHKHYHALVLTHIYSYTYAPTPPTCSTCTQSYRHAHPYTHI